MSRSTHQSGTSSPLRCTNIAAIGCVSGFAARAQGGPNLALHQLLAQRRMRGKQENALRVVNQPSTSKKEHVMKVRPLKPLAVAAAFAVLGVSALPAAAADWSDTSISW